MRMIQTANYAEMSHTAAVLILNQLLEKPDSNLGLATGQTPSGLYRELIATRAEMGMDLSQVQFFHLDEYLGMDPDDPESMAAFLRQQLLDPMQIPAKNCHFVPANATNPNQACEAYEAEIAAYGGIDLQILGIGNNGHIAFNEPGTAFSLSTHIATLSASTRQTNARFFVSGQTPEAAMTMGPRSILQAKQILILAAGKAKAQAVRQMLQDPMTESCQASVLRYHPHVTLIVDREAASALTGETLQYQPLPLHVFDTTDKELGIGQKLLVAAPHPDDASISCGGTLSRFKRQGCQLHFVSMSSGHRAEIPGSTQMERVQIRTLEAQREAELFDSEFTALNLPFYDHHYIPGREDVLRLLELLHQVQPDFVFSTSLRDRHPAHRASAFIVQEAVREYAQITHKWPELWCYEGPWYLFEREDFNTVVTFLPEDLDLKLQGVLAHQSQVRRKRYDLAADALSRFRAITVPESRLSGFGTGMQDLGEHIEIFQRWVLKT